MANAIFFIKVFITSTLLLKFCGVASAQQIDSSSLKKNAPWFVEKFKLGAGFFLPVNNTNVRVDANGNDRGTNIDFESDLGFATSIGTFLAQFQWRVSRRSRINVSYFKINRNTGHTLEKDIVFKKDTFYTGLYTNSFFNTTIYQFSYGYAILSKPKYELGLVIGAHVVGGKSGIAGNTNSGGDSKKDDFGFTAPLPDLGIWGGYAFTKRLALNLEVRYLALTVGETAGSIFSYNIALTYKIVDRFNIALGFAGLNCTVDAVQEDNPGHIKWAYNGPSFVATYSFGKFH